MTKIPNPIATQRFSLAIWTLNDLIDLLDLDEDPDVVRFVGPTPPRPERKRGWLEAAPQPETRPVMCIRDKVTSEFLGWIYLRPFKDDTNDWELGYRLKKSAWGRGVATEVAQSIIAWGWRQSEIAVIGAVHEPGNLASRAVMMKIGLKPKGTRLYYDGAILDYCELRRDQALNAAKE
jgi:RimJ/RimL family protein N-acetyltransferase